MTNNQDITATDGKPQPDLSQVEGARVLANESREQLSRIGLADDDVIALAERYVQEGRGTDASSFLSWVQALDETARR